MTAHPLSVVTAKLAMHPELIAGQGCSVALLQNFPGDPAASIIIAIDADFSTENHKSLYRLLTGRDVDKEARRDERIP